VVTVLTLALALGVNTAIFSVLNATLLRLLPAPKAEQLVILTDPNASMVLGGMLLGERSLLTFPEFVQLRDGMKTVAGLCASQLTLETWPIQVGRGAQKQVRGRIVSENYFTVFGVKPAVGRFFRQTDATGVGKDPYAVISYDFWQRRFGGSQTIIGKSFRLHGTSYAIIGVAAPGFHGETVGQEPDVWLPMMMQPLAMLSGDGLKGTLGESSDKLMWLHAFGRRKAGVTVGQVPDSGSGLSGDDAEGAARGGIAAIHHGETVSDGRVSWAQRIRRTVAAAAGVGGVGAVGGLRECGESAAGAGGDADTRGGDPAGDGGGTQPVALAVYDREPGAGDVGRDRRFPGGASGDANSAAHAVCLEPGIQHCRQH
jgi:hypothetical protein